MASTRENAVDSQGIVRHITRDVVPPSILRDGAFHALAWPEIIKKLVSLSGAADESVKANIADTIYMENGVIMDYVFTNVEGYLARKPQKSLSLKRVHDEFVKIGARLQDQAAPLYLATINENAGSGSGTVRMLDSAELQAFCAGPVPTTATILQCFIPSKGKPSIVRTYRTNYWLDDAAHFHMKTDRLDVNPIVSGNAGIKSKTNMDRVSNTQMESMCQQVVFRIQSAFKVKIVSCWAEWVQDINSKIHLLRINECVIAREKSAPPRSVSPQSFKNTRVGKIAEYGENLGLLNNSVAGGGSTDSLSQGFVRSKPSSIGHNSDERIERRNMKDAPPDETMVNEIMMNSGRGRSRLGSRSKSRAGTANGSSRSPTRERERAASRSLSPEPQSITFSVPNARLGSEIPIAESTGMFGSTQLNGCQGDFCKFDLRFIENPEVGAGVEVRKQDKKLSEFRQRLMISDGMPDDNVGINAHLTSLIKGGDDEGVADASAIDERALKTVSYRTIMQCRQEMPLVKLQLRRHKRGEKGEYVSNENFADIAVSNKLPAHTYKEVPCCMNCFKIYAIITEAREKALKKIEKKRDHQHFQQMADVDAGGSVSSVKSSSSSKKGNLHSSMFSPVKPVASFPASSDATPSASASNESLRAAVEAIDSLTKLDVAEIRTMVKPPAAVEVVLEAVIALLTGKNMTFQETRRLLGGGEAFLVMLREFKLEDITDARLRLVEPYADNPVFRPENVVGVSYCASKFCAWVLGVVQAARWQRGYGHKRTDAFTNMRASAELDSVPEMMNARNLEYTPGSVMKGSGGPRLGGTLDESSVSSYEELTFVQKLERKKAMKSRDQKSNSSGGASTISRQKGGKDIPSTIKERLQNRMSQSMSTLPSVSMGSSLEESPAIARRLQLSDSSTLGAPPSFDLGGVSGGGSLDSVKKKKKGMSQREQVAMASSQKKAAERLSSHNKTEGNLGAVGQSKEFRCADGITKIPYIVLGNVSLTVKRCNFVVVHDFFDTCDATAIMFKPIVQVHDGCQVICFNYPGQANTVWPRLPAAERERGAKEPILNNDWIADRLHELLQQAEEDGSILLSSPFHLVGFGNGASIAAAFCQRWGDDSRYSNSIRSLVSVNGFLYPDPQLTSILHSAAQVFESTPHNRPDIPVSFWSRFIFSDDYLRRVNPNLALNIFTAVSNPITNDGRAKITRGCIQHRDLRGCLAPDQASVPVQIPVIILQSTENTLINAANVDPFLTGRNTRHLWSHQLNNLSPQAIFQSQDPTAGFVGKYSSGPVDYQRYSILGKMGLGMVLETLKNPRGAFVMWTRSGHAIHQENKAAVMDLLDVLACPTDEYTGLNIVESQGAKQQASRQAMQRPIQDVLDSESAAAKMEVLFKLVPPKHVVSEGLPARESKTHQTEIDSTTTKKSDDVLQSISERKLILHVGSSREQEQTDEQKLEVLEDEGEKEPEPEPEPEPVLEETAEEATFSLPAQETNFEAATAVVEMPSSAPIDRTLEIETSENIESIEIVAPTSSSPSLSPYSLHNETSEGAVEEPKQLRKEEKTEKEEVVETSPTPIVTSPSVVPIAPPQQASLRSEADIGRNEGTINSNAVEFPAVSKHPRPTLPEASLQATTPSRRPGSPSATTAADTPTRVAATAQTKYSVTLGSLESFESTKDQRNKKEWTSAVPDATTTLELEAELARKQKEFLDLETKAQQDRAFEASMAMRRFDEDQALRRKQYEDEDQLLLQKLQKELEDRRRERDAAEKQRRLQLQEIEKRLVKTGVIEEYGAPTEMMVDEGSVIIITSNNLVEPVHELPPLRYEVPGELPAAITEKQDVVSQLDRMVEDEENARKKGIMSMEDYEKVKRTMAQRQVERDQKLRGLADDEQEALLVVSLKEIQRVARGYNGRKKAKVAAEDRRILRKKKAAIIKAQALIRGFNSRQRVKSIKRLYQLNLLRGNSVIAIQSFFRGYLARRYFKKIRRFLGARNIQRVFRGRIGRAAANRERKRLNILRKKQRAASVIQSTWRMKIAKEEFRSLRIHVLAAIEIQRCYRGYLGRKIVARRREWESATPGPERIKLGLKLIEESKVAFERQQEEIDALHRAQERAEARVSHIHSELKDSEKELIVLERELQEIDQIERDLQTLTHEKNVLLSGISDAAGMPRTAMPGHAELVMGRESNNANDPDLERRKRAEAYALEMTIQIKRAEREKKRQELETEFAAVFQEVEKKKRALERLESSLADMEATRERKDREFRRLQRNLMQLLLEQKQELDDLREKGIELETATATTAAAATATALKAKEHEKRSTAMFSQTEELMKFQFMSMSLSYFSSLNMLKQLRDMNSDTTSAAVASSADAAAAAAAASAAANLPNMKKMDLGANDFVELSIQKKKAELQVAENAEQEAKKAKAHPLPENVKLWSVTDVCRWLDALFLGQYSNSFREAAVDGPFLMELREEDMIQVLGITHKLHVRKILVSREKLKPLTAAEKARLAEVEKEMAADSRRREIGAPDLETVFSQARNGRTKRVEESLNLGFQIDLEDSRGNTLLLIAAQNSNKRLVEMLVIRGATINHQNAQGNTALHFALAFDTEGQLGEYLIEHGADDTIENVSGLTAYDGLGEQV